MLEEQPLRPWSFHIFRSYLVLNGILFIILGTIRGYGLLGPSSARSLILLNFLLMWFLPIIFLSKTGRREIGLRKPPQIQWLLWGFLLGLGFAFLYFLLGIGLYGNTIENWFINISTQFLPADTSSWGMSKIELFLIVTTPAIIFSPIGEEFYFRGMIHESAKRRWNQKKGATINALAFSGIHLLHHGVIVNETGLHVLWISGLIFFCLMMALSVVLTVIRTRTTSIWPAVFLHAGFNLMMNITVFAFLL